MCTTVLLFIFFIFFSNCPRIYNIYLQLWCTFESHYTTSLHYSSIFQFLSFVLCAVIIRHFTFVYAINLQYTVTNFYLASQLCLEQFLQEKNLFYIYLQLFHFQCSPFFFFVQIQVLVMNLPSFCLCQSLYFFFIFKRYFCSIEFFQH